MPEFQYTSKKTMPPRPGVKYSTDYYKQPISEYRLTVRHIQHVAKEVSRVCDEHSGWKVWCSSPLKGFPKSDNTKYSLNDIVTDMLGQTIKERDIPSGMLSRWNRLFHGTEWDLVMVTGTPARAANSTYGDIFDAKR
jgi:hypothetical protein